MYSFDSHDALLGTLTLPLDPHLHRLITDRVKDAIARDLGDLTHILIVQAGDTEADIIDAIGFSPLVHRIHGTRFGDPAFEPDWDWWERHDGWTELLYCVGDTGFAYVLFVQDAEGMLPELRSLCRASR
ncbi:hypothetical protein BH10PLA2_BH10PLA2_03460 [soil metagenome]